MLYAMSTSSRAVNCVPAGVWECTTKALCMTTREPLGYNHISLAWHGEKAP